jgi:hypothetical protein
MGRDVFHGNSSEIARRLHTEVACVHIAKLLVDLAGEHTSMTKSPEGEVKPAKAGEKVDEGHRAGFLKTHTIR